MKGLSSFALAVFVIASFQLQIVTASCWRTTKCSGPEEPSFPGPWQSNLYAPYNRTYRPQSVFTIRDRMPATYPRTVYLRENGTNVVFDFGREVGGIVSINYTANATAIIGLAFTEAYAWIGETSDSSNGQFTGQDGALYINITINGQGTYQMPDEVMRGGFRFMTAFVMTTTDAWVIINDVSLEISFQPTWPNLRAYQGYFNCDDLLLNRIWYAGAYTLQTNVVPTNTGRWVPMLKKGWANNGTLGPGDSILVDGAKRDRAVWPGDMGIAVPSNFVSIGDPESVKNALQVMYDYQNHDGSFPEAGPPLLQQNSDTYHMWTMIGTYNYMLYRDDASFLQSTWPKYVKAMDFIHAKVGQSGLLNQTGTRDWGRWQTGFNNTQANVILYHTLRTGALLSRWMNDTKGFADVWTERAVALQNAINTHCFDENYGAFRDNATSTTLHPQDANSMAVLFGVVNASSSTASSISSRLTDNWSPIGAVSPELPGNISPFISGFEIQAHFTVGQTARALDLIRRSWGWYANHRNGTASSTVIEGYRADGTFGYRSERGYGNDPSYVSHAHGWSTGPTSALTEFVVGLSITESGGRAWKLKPQFGNLKLAEAGFTTGLGKFQAKWKKNGTAYTLDLDTPSGTIGKVSLPIWDIPGQALAVVNGKKLDSSQFTREECHFVFELQGGKYEIEVK